MQKIILTQGKYAIVDNKDFERVNQYKWYALKNGKVYYAMSRLGGGRNGVSLHRFLLNYPKGIIDHINMNGLDNTRSNLRISNHSLNALNGTVTKRNKLGVRGVSKVGNKFVVRISKDGVDYHLGTYETIQKATEIYKHFHKKLCKK
jgi:hypothetical protein